MRFSLKKTTLALIALGLSAGAFANGGTVAPPVYNVTLPHTDAAWDVGGEIFWYEPNMHNLGYALTNEATHFNTYTQNVATFHYVDPDHDFGFSLWGSYHFAGCGEDLVVDFTYLDADDSSSVNDAHNVYPTLLPLHSNGSYDYAKAKADVEYWHVDAMLGQHVDFGPSLDVHMAAGLRYADLDTKFKAQYDDTDGGPYVVYRDNVRYRSEFEGIGPRVAFDSSYHIGSGFGFVAGCGMSMLIGDIDSSARQQVWSSNSPHMVLTSDWQGRKHGDDSVVPELDAKIGLDYAYNMADNGSVTIEAGWKTMSYFDVHHRARGVQNLHNNDAVIETASNVTFHGPYAAITYRSA